MENSIPTMPKKKNTWLYGKIETKEGALTIIKTVSHGFYFLAVVQSVLGYFLMGVSAIIDGVIFAVCAFLLRKFNSRVVAIILLLLSSGAFIYTAINKVGGGTGGKNLLLAVLMFWASVRAVQATFGLKKFQ